MLPLSVRWDQSLTFKVMLVGDKSGGLKPQDDHSKTESGNRESQRQLQDNVFVPNILKSDQIGLFTSSGIKDARSILISMERSDIKTGSVPLSCIFQRSRINVHQVAGSFLFTKMPHLWHCASFDRPRWRCCSEGGILHNWRRWEGQYNKSYPGVCVNCRLHLSKLFFFCVHNWNSTMHHKILRHYTVTFP